MKTYTDAVGLPFESPVGKAAVGVVMDDGQPLLPWAKAWSRPFQSRAKCRACGEFRWVEWDAGIPRCADCRAKGGER